MNGLILGLYGVFLVAVGIGGKTENLLSELDKDMPGFIPWALAIVGLIILAQSEATAKVVKPFAFLLILNFVLMNSANLAKEIGRLSALANRSNAQ